MVADITGLPEPTESRCNVLSENICSYIFRDTFTVVLTIWIWIQLIWVSMLMLVQLLQVARALTTYESMRGPMEGSTKAAEAITSALTAGTTSMEGAQLTGPRMGPNHAASRSHSTRSKKKGFFATWKQLLGLDAFVATATGSLDGTNRRRRGNPYSRGIVTNCRDFWCDPAPYFGKRENGVAMLDGEIVNYTKMYESPPRMRSHGQRRDGEGGLYHSIGAEESV